MLVERVVPYTDNVTALKDLVATQPGLTLPVSFLVREVSKNYLLHESCHCLAHEALFGRESLRTWAKEAPIEFVLRMTLAEGFAVGTELIAASQRDPAVALFGALSSYSLFGEADSRLVSVAVEQLGWDGAIRGAVYGAFLAQLILPGEPADGVSEIAEAGLGIAKASDAYRCGFVPLVKAASSLAPGFCTVTVPTFFSFLGLDHTFTDRAFRQQVLGAFDGVHKQAVDELCGALARAVTEGNKS